MVSSSCYNRIENNSISNSIYYGLQLVDDTNNNLISVNVIKANRYGLLVKSSSNNTININNFTDNLVGIVFDNSSNNIVYQNNFIENNNHVDIIKGIDANKSENVFDNFKEGNYWDNYNDTDNNGNGIGDLPYIIDENNQDNYPLMEAIIIPEFSSWIILPISIIVTIVGIIFRKVVIKKGRVE
jgi:parallel beta-helix repeat protein